MRVYYDTVPSDIGKLAIGVCSWGVRWVIFAGEAHNRFGDDAVRDRGAVRFVSEQIEEYFARERTRFELPIAWDLFEGFSSRVWREMTRVPYGETTTYGAVARAIESPSAARAVGRSCGANPLLLLVPCHRVVGVDGSLGGFRGGAATKAQLLAHEGVILPVD